MRQWGHAKSFRCRPLKIEDIDADSAINSVKALLEKERDMSPALKSALEVLLILVSLLLNKKPGGQKGHNGTTLVQADDPDEVTELMIDRRTLPKGTPYQAVGQEIRQAIDIDISRFVTEYRAQILEDNQENRFVAPFPEGVSRPVQYGLGIKANAVYLSQYQLIPYDRIRDHFQNQVHIPVSVGSVFNFNKEAYAQLEPFEQWAKKQFAQSDLMHADETGINIGGKRHWLRGVSDIEDYLKKQRPNARHQMKANERENGASSNDRKPEACWRDCETSSKMSCALLMWIMFPSSTIRERMICA